MRVTCVGIKPTQSQLKTGAPLLTPEMLAACGARYSRNGEGLDSILDRIAGQTEDAAVDSIFRMIDYGHQSIADMVPIAMFMDQISLWLALRIWSASPTAGGQESSTRYIKIDDNSRDCESLFQSGHSTSCYEYIGKCFSAYNEALDIWSAIAKTNADLMRLPAGLLSSEDPKDIQKVKRMSRNFAFDRARYFLPMCAKTNVMQLMSARGWVALIKQLASEQLQECRELAKLLLDQMTAVAPRLIKHARFDESFASGFAFEFSRHSKHSAANGARPKISSPAPASAFLEVNTPQGTSQEDIVSAMQFHRGRYDFYGSALTRTSVRFGWQALPIADIRDFNRHRTGSKYFSLVPVGTYFADDEVERTLEQDPSASQICERLARLREIGEETTAYAFDRMAAGYPDFVYLLPMGAQCYYEHTTTANHFLYQAELRTGIGSHYHYAARMAEVLALWHGLFPETAKYIKAGSAEPE